jgi:hypothetical protein
MILEEHIPKGTTLVWETAPGCRSVFFTSEILETL